jgi:hypothetical protein
LIRFLKGGDNVEALKEALKELARVVVLAIIPILIDSLSSGEVDLRVIAIAGAIAGLRFVDKLLHLNAPEGTAGGLTRF